MFVDDIVIQLDELLFTGPFNFICEWILRSACMAGIHQQSRSQFSSLDSESISSSAPPSVTDPSGQPKEDLYHLHRGHQSSEISGRLLQDVVFWTSVVAQTIV